MSQQDDGRSSDNGDDGGQEPDLRTLFKDRSARRRLVYTEADSRPGGDERPGAESPFRGTVGEVDDEVAPPYVPPVRPGDPVRPPEQRPPQYGEPREPQQREKLPPVWPGDEKQPWFRRERGLPPLPEGEAEQIVDPEELPTPLAEIRTRGRAWGVTFLLPNVVSVFYPIGGIVLGLLILVPNLFLFRRGQDVGTVLFGLRVVRENGDLAGFFHMFVRNAASTISFLVLGAGFFSAFSDPYRRTWHDKWMKTYVVQDSKEYATRKASSSENAFNWFWIIILLFIAISVLAGLATAVPPETPPPTE